MTDIVMNNNEKDNDEKDNIDTNPQMIFQSGGKDLYGAGFKINHRIFENSDKNTKINIKDDFNNIFKNMVIPFGLYFENKEENTLNKHKYHVTDEVIKDDIFNNLLKLVDRNERKNVDIRTRKNKKTTRKTRKASKK